LSETKKRSGGWKLAAQENQKLLSSLLQQKKKKLKKRDEGYINAVSTNSNVQVMDETKRDLKE
jgi:hypothetical protein